MFLSQCRAATITTQLGWLATEKHLQNSLLLRSPPASTTSSILMIINFIALRNYNPCHKKPFQCIDSSSLSWETQFEFGFTCYSIRISFKVFIKGIVSVLWKIRFHGSFAPRFIQALKVTMHGVIIRSSNGEWKRRSWLEKKVSPSTWSFFVRPFFSGSLNQLETMKMVIYDQYFFEGGHFFSFFFPSQNRIGVKGIDDGDGGKQMHDGSAMAWCRKISCGELAKLKNPIMIL